MAFALLIACVGLTGPAAFADEGDDAPPARQHETLPNPENFFARLTERYRRLSYYEDSVAVVETVDRDGDRPNEVRTRISCRIEGDRLRVDTPGTQTRPELGVSSSPAMESLVLRYNLWQAPHMTLHFLEEPLRDFRAGIPAGFRVGEAEKIVAGESTLVRIELAATDDSAGATFVLWVNPDSMLIERIEGSQKLPDGARLRINLEIEVVRADGA